MNIDSSYNNVDNNKTKILEFDKSNTGITKKDDNINKNLTIETKEKQDNKEIKKVNEKNDYKEIIKVEEKPIFPISDSDDDIEEFEEKKEKDKNKLENDEKTKDILINAIIDMMLSIAQNFENFYNNEIHIKFSKAKIVNLKENIEKDTEIIKNFLRLGMSNNTTKLYKAMNFVIKNPESSITMIIAKNLLISLYIPSYDEKLNNKK